MPPKRTTRQGSANQLNEIADLVAQQIRAAILELITQITAGLNASNANNNVNQRNEREVPVNNKQGCSYKAFMSWKPKEFHKTEGAVGLLSWIESVESVLHISRCATNCQVEYAACQFQKRALTWWNTLV